MPQQRPPLLYLVHRIPYPPNKGDKVRSFNILRQLARRYRVFLGAFVDHPDDLRYVNELGKWCEAHHIVTLNPKQAKITSLRGLLTFEALSLVYYRDAGLAAWAQATVKKEGICQAVAFSGPMAQYLDIEGLERKVVDFCDVDSAKWTQYAKDHRWPLSSLYRREGRRLLAFERRAAVRADAALFVTEAEAALFCRAAPEAEPKVRVMQNGVDADYFSPEQAGETPYPAGGPVLLFTGAMDYWPNVNAVIWFTREVLPDIRAQQPNIRFWIVGMAPVPEVLALGGEAGVTVTGSVPDVRPYLGHADVVVAPLQIARGIQNKVLEAMAMARPTVVSAASATGLGAVPGIEYEIAETAGDYRERVLGLMRNAARRQAMGEVARACVVKRYSWQAHLGILDQLLGDHTLKPGEWHGI